MLACPPPSSLGGSAAAIIAPYYPRTRPLRWSNAAHLRRSVFALATLVVLLDAVAHAAPEGGAANATHAARDGDATHAARDGDAAHAPINAIVPPRVRERAALPYPDGAVGDATVVVTVTVNVDGTVRSATAYLGQSPFSEVAVASVEQWRFEPALRDGKPTAATIRLEVTFHAPVVERLPDSVDAAEPPMSTDGDAPANARSGRDSAPAAPAHTTEPIEVTVLGERPAPMVVSLARTEVRQIPGTFGDPFRALEVLPGVTPIISGLPYFYIRGAPPGNVGYYLDSIRVPYLYHVAVGPSVVNPAMVDRVDLHRGGYPARFGRYAGGIVAAKTTAPNVVTRGEATIRLYDAGAMVETGFAGGRGTVLLGGRYSYTAAIISLAAKGVTLDYRDYQARISYDLTPRDTVTLFGFGAYDLLAQERNGIATIGFGTEFYRGDLRWDHTLAGDGLLRTAITLGYDQTSVGGQRNAQDRMLGLRSELEQPIARHVWLRAGVDSQFDAYRVTRPIYDDPDNPNSRRFSDLFPPRKDAVVGTHAEVSIAVQRNFTVTPGLRLDYYVSGGATAIGVDPRISAKLDVSERFAIVHAYGLAHQPPSFVLPVPGLALGSLENGLQSAYQASAGIIWELAPSTSLTANAFYNLFTNMTDALSIPERRGQSFGQRTRGNAYGLEFFLHRNLTRDLGGLLSYTLSRSNRYLDGAEFPSAFDRRHVLNAAVAYDLGRRWRAGTRFTFYTGAPKRATTTTTTTNTEAPTAAAASTNLIRNPERDPAFYRLDLRLEKLWPIGKSGHVSFVAEVLNATMSKESFNGAEIGPIFVPSLGCEGGF